MSVSKSSIPFSWEGRTQRVQEQHPACFCSAGTKGNYERTAQGQNRSRLGAAPAVGGQAVPPLNASVTGTRWHKTKTTRRSDASPPAARRVLLCLTWNWLANRAAERLKPPSCTDGFLHQPRYVSLGSALGCLAPQDPLFWRHWKRPPDPSAVRKSTLLRDASDKSPLIPSLFPDPRKFVTVLQFTTPRVRRKVELEEELFQTSPIFSTLLSKLFNTYRPSNHVGFHQPNWYFI